MVNPDKPVTLKSLFQRLHAIYPLSTDLKDQLDEVMEIKFIKRSTYLLKPGQIPSYIYFVEKGMIRHYCQIGDKEISTGFRKEGDLVAIIECFKAQTRTVDYLYSLEDCIVYSLSYEDYKKTCQQFPEFIILLLLLMERNYALSEECLNVIKTLNAHGRYAWLNERLPGLSLRVAAKHLASYIGITEVMLSIVKNGK